MLEEGLVNHPVVGFGESGRKSSDLRVLLAKIEESEVCYSSFLDIDNYLPCFVIFEFFFSASDMYFI